MKVLRKWLAAPLATLMLLSGLSLAAPAAQAAPGCASGWACVWQSYSYTGQWAAAKSDGPLSVTSDKNGVAKTKSASAWANGRLCKHSYFQDGKGKSFRLDSEQLVRTNYRDPNLSNGAGKGTYAGENWNDRVRSVVFSGGPQCK
ncbi:hypothetical protein DDD63_11210 [Actinobaculum sp. 313]|nr:hypothetical protein DDD63_11210 [Actinobaculum sp. 313]